MSQTISLKLSDFDAALLSELSKREAKTPEELILENEQELLTFVDNYCRVKKLFREDIQVDISLAK